MLSHVARDRFRDPAGKLWSLTKKGWRKRKPKADGPLRSQTHLAYVRDLGCGIGGCHCQPVHAHHHRSAATAGTALTPSDFWCVNLCHVHHREGHDGGWKTFERKYGVDLRQHALWVAAHSPDIRIREAARAIA